MEEVDEEALERARERKKQKNQRKKRKKVERKAVKDHQDSIQRLWSAKLLQEYQSRTQKERGPPLQMLLHGSQHLHGTQNCSSVKGQQQATMA